MTLKNTRYFIEAVFIKAFFHALHLFPFHIASNIGSFLGRKIGPLLSVNKTAYRNIRRAFPDFTEKEIKKTINGMWDNLGRTVAEFPHMQTIHGQKLDEFSSFEGLENLYMAKLTGQPIIFFSGHFANWEMVPKTMYEKGCPANLVYRKSNNPYIEELIMKVRSQYQNEGIPKGPIGARKLIKAISERKYIGMLIDQKQNDGIAVPFFGHDAMTAPAVASLTLRYDCILLPIKVLRTEKFKFKTTIFEPLEIKRTDDFEKDIYNIMRDINSLFEKWIKESPSQWFWVHNRWSDKRK